MKNYIAALLVCLLGGSLFAMPAQTDTIKNRPMPAGQETAPPMIGMPTPEHVMLLNKLQSLKKEWRDMMAAKRKARQAKQAQRREEMKKKREERKKHQAAKRKWSKAIDKAMMALAAREDSDAKSNLMIAEEALNEVKVQPVDDDMPMGEMPEEE